MKPLDKWNKPRIALLYRVLGLYLLLGVWSLTLVGRLVDLQIFKSEEYRLKAEQQQLGYIELSPKRGDILDRHLDELAISVKIDSVFAHPKEVREPLRTARALASVLGKQEEELFELLIGDRPFVYLARKIPPRQADQIRELNLPGVYFQEETKRIYPGRELAAHVLGFAGLDSEGLAGLEYLYNDSIKGKNTRVDLHFDARRNSYASDASDARPEKSDGNTIVLSIDRPIQYIAQQVLEDTFRSSQAVSGTAIVMDPNTGEILAMASLPSFDPNLYSDSEAEDRRNRAILDIYEPGSTFKLVTFAAVLNEGLVEPSELIDCHVETLRLAGRTYREANQSFGLLSFNEVLANSSNIGTIKLSLRLGEEKLYQYIRNFGFGQKTGIDLPGEQVGLLRPPSEWSRISIGALALGQEVGVTPLQMLTAASAIANGGYLVTPRVVRHILTPEGDVFYEPQTSRKQILRPETTLQMKEALSLAVTDGTGRNAQLDGYSSGGKTGTAQKFVDGKYSDTLFIASYVGFAPLQDPVLAIIVVINEPKGQYHGGQLAAPAFKQIAERSLIHLRVPRDQALRIDNIPPQTVSRELAASPGVSVEEEQIPPEQLEETVLTLIQEESSNQKLPNTITVELSPFQLPDFSGLSLREVVRRCAGLGLRLKVSGAGTAIGQRPPAGSQVSQGMVCEVFFSNNGHDASSRVALQADRPVAPRAR
ncbi:MAG: penicillin-binding transpeptidase domain-containing protein [Acidobacteria bacterium]|nr:penicillin-binding transpeptidase domain-containing protein [Acidobacteriota bacterium]